MEKLKIKKSKKRLTESDVPRKMYDLKNIYDLENYLQHINLCVNVVDNIKSKCKDEFPELGDILEKYIHDNVLPQFQDVEK